MKYLQKETVIAYLIISENSQKEIIDLPQHSLFLFRTFTGYINRYREVSFIEPLRLLSVSCFFLNKKVWKKPEYRCLFLLETWKMNHKTRKYFYNKQQLLFILNI